ncbi:hypothetical protein CO2235_U850032 [Cupriavidus oxalaticus]|uniref:Uncharacterized protein n=1 Tax=Cupriavidus oxalaticus TaxID=96344 RepID=A0A375FVE6_9BURK|nr:hypothetical protein CO2235_U850032 [Cupriavidus oxalaticus]
MPWLRTSSQPNGALIRWIVRAEDCSRILANTISRSTADRLRDI